MNLREKTLIFCTFLTSCLAIALISTGLGTQYWIEATAYRSTNDKSKGEVHFGLFQGERLLNHGFGQRIYQMDILDIMFREQQYMVKELFITTIATAVGGIFFGVISSLLSILNTASNPVEAVCHYTGLTIFNGLACFACIVSVVSWIAQFFLKLSKNVMIREDFINGEWRSEGRARLGFSFWLVLLSALIYAANTVLITCIRKRKYKRNIPTRQIIEAKPNGNLMLY